MNASGHVLEALRVSPFRIFRLRLIMDGIKPRNATGTPGPRLPTPALEDVTSPLALEKQHAHDLISATGDLGL